ncbi:enoyl-CoA hydratase-related protein [Streptomyces canus]|uniref:enoyl-CoA hydratase-related protein n=1 Tax=Streptomyces canus TaxID=58343 RepID=UPI003722AA4F
MPADRKPVIAAIDGWCVGAGVDLAAAADGRLSTDRAVFSVRETRMAVVADLGSLQRLVGIVGDGHLREPALTGRNVEAEEAKRIGLVNHTTPQAPSSTKPRAGSPPRWRATPRWCRPVPRMSSTPSATRGPKQGCGASPYGTRRSWPAGVSPKPDRRSSNDVVRSSRAHSRQAEPGAADADGVVRRLLAWPGGGRSGWPARRRALIAA